MEPTQTLPRTPIEQRAENGFTLSLLVAGVRCILMYAVLPFVLPLLGISGRLALPFDIALVSIAAVALLLSIRRFWKINYRWKVPYTVVGLAALGVYVSFLVLDVQMLLQAPPL